MTEKAYREALLGDGITDNQRDQTEQPVISKTSFGATFDNVKEGQGRLSDMANIKGSGKDAQNALEVGS